MASRLAFVWSCFHIRRSKR